MKILLFLLIVSFAARSQTSYVPSTQVLKEKGHQLRVAGDFFNTIKNVDKDGETTELVGGESFSRYQGELGALYGATDQLQFGVGARFRQNSSTFTTDNKDVSASGMGIESTYASINYAFRPVGQFHYTLEGQYRYRPFTNDEYDSNDLENLILGDDGPEYSLGLGVTYAFKSNNFITVRGGHRAPGTDLSDEIYWQTEGAMAWKYLALVAGVDGVKSLQNDPYENDPEGRPVLNTGKTQLYNSSNREWIAPYAGINFTLGKNWRVEFKGGQVIDGIATDLGTFFGIQLVRRGDPVSSKHPDTKFKSYDIEASVTKVSPEKNYVVIDHGLSKDVQNGMVFDFFEFDYVGGNILVARGVVVKAKAETAIVKITNRYNTKTEIKEGLVARAAIRKSLNSDP